VLKPIVTIARHELGITIATRRAAAAAILYLVAAVLGGVGYLLSVRAIEQQAIQALVDKGVDSARAAASVSVAGQQAYQRLIMLLAGTAPEPVAASFTDSVILPAFFWGSLAFLPFLVLLTSFDMLAADLQARSLCYTVLRAPRVTVLLGKVAAQAILFVGLTVVASVALVGVALAMLTTFQLGAALPGLLRAWALLLPYGLCYLGLSAFCSASTRQPTLALVEAIGLMIALRILGLLAHIPEDAKWALLRPLQWLSPAHYQAGLWEASPSGPLISVAAYLAFGAAFLALAARLLDRRDL
jgi:ABC-type transport system involved in multi-copper enzyme maturation permease subunit